MERVLVALRFVFVLEPVLTVAAAVLLLHLVVPASGKSKRVLSRKGEGKATGMTHSLSCRLLNFLGFLGQHSHM